jgi:hypothetical protein
LRAQAAALVAVLTGCGGTSSVTFPLTPHRGPPPIATVESLPAIPREELCAGHLVVEIDRLLVRKYPRISTTPPFRYLPLVAGVLSLPGGVDEDDVTLVAGKQVYRMGDRVRVFEGRLLLDRPVYRLRGLVFEVHLAENHSTIVPLWMTYTNVASQAAQALPGPTSGAIDVGAQIIRMLDKDDIMLTWTPPLDDLVQLARQLGQVRYRLVTPAVLPDGTHAAELDLIVRMKPDDGCH